MALISIFRLMPRWLCAVIAISALASAGATYERRRGAEIIQKQWDASKAEIAAAEIKAIAARVADNSKLAIKQAADAAAIQQDHDHEIASLHARIAAAPRLHVGATFCDRPSGAASVPDAASSDVAIAGARLLSDGVDDAVKSLIEQTEEVAATARACQAGVRAAGIAPL